MARIISTEVPSSFCSGFLFLAEHFSQGKKICYTVHLVICVLFFSSIYDIATCVQMYTNLYHVLIVHIKYVKCFAISYDIKLSKYTTAIRVVEFSSGPQNQKDFFIRINIPKRNFGILRFGLMASCQNQGIILVNKVIYKLILSKNVNNQKCAP